MPSGVSFDHILVPTWSEANGQDDLQWYWASREWNGSYSVTIDVRNHNNESGTYRADAYAIDTTGEMHLLGQTTVEMPEIAQYHEISGYAAITYESLVGLYNNFSSIDFPSYYTENGRNVDLNRFAQLYIEEANAEGIRADVAFAQAMKETGWLKFGGQVSISQFNFAGKKKAEGIYETEINLGNHNYSTGKYYVDTYGVDNNGKQVYLGGTTFLNTENTISGLTLIKGIANISYQRLVNLYDSSGNTFPSYYTENGRNVDLDRFAQLYIEEANAEGIRADVAFAQAMKETGWLKFGGQVSISQFNFAGLGATDDGAAGMSFAQKYGDNENGIRMGIRAQIQHLKAYASTEPLNNVCVDERFNLVKRGCAPYVEWLGQKENPNGYGWATGANYGQGIIDIMNRIP